MAQQPPRILTISQKSGLFTRDLQIHDSTGTQLYDIRGCKSDIWTITNLLNPQAPLQIAFHGRLRADVSLPGRPGPFSLSLTGGLFHNGYPFPSASGVEGGELMWSGGDSKRTLTPTAAGGQWIAKYDKAFFGSKATLEVVDGGGSALLLDEVVVTAVAVADIIRRRKNAGN